MECFPLATAPAVAKTDYVIADISLADFGRKEILIAETDYRSEVELVTSPLRGLALGVFLITVGMQLDLDALIADWPTLLIALVGVLIVKALVTAMLLRLSGSRRGTAAETGLLMASPSETTLILLGRFLETRAKRRSSAALRGLLELGAKEARVLRDGVETVVSVAELRAGELFVVRPGEKVATDGVVEDGVSAVDQSMLTGEPVPTDVGPGDPVAAATINTSGRLLVRATRVGGDTAVARPRDHSLMLMTRPASGYGSGRSST